MPHLVRGFFLGDWRLADRGEAEQRFPHKVDIPVPSMTGLGGRLNEMLVWSRENVAAGERAQHG
jgi:hypothetical protein